MSTPGKARWTMAGVVEAPVDDVWDALIRNHALLPAADKDAAAHGSGVQSFTVPLGEPGAGRIHIEIDSQRHSIAEQGEWWYRGVQSVEPDARGSRIVWRVYNIAPPASRWLVPLAIRRFDTQMQERLRQLLQALGDHLGCRAYPLS